MNPAVRADPERMRTAARELALIGRDIGDDVERLRRDAAAVMEAHWVGDASDSHRALWNEWVESAQHVVATLLTDAELVDRAARGYDHTEASAAKNITGRLRLDEVR